MKIFGGFEKILQFEIDLRYKFRICVTLGPNLGESFINSLLHEIQNKVGFQKQSK